jgi:hypothetical protein
VTAGDGEWELVRLHAYHGERALARSPRLAPLGVIAGAHHERLDGSGYHRGSAGARLPVEARLLAAADCYQAMTHARPYRERLDPERAAGELQAQVRAGRLDGAAVQAVLTVADHTGKAGSRAFPAGLSDREAQVLTLLARGNSNRQIASQLGITPKTAGHHVEHLYAKIGSPPGLQRPCSRWNMACCRRSGQRHVRPGQAAWGVHPMPASERAAYVHGVSCHLERTPQ